MNGYLEMQAKLQVLGKHYESLTRLLTAYNPKPRVRDNLKKRRQVVANQIWEVKLWLFTH